jgi:hypothetical protein
MTRVLVILRRSFFAAALNDQSNKVGPSQAGMIGLPLVAANRPSTAVIDWCGG